jgi:hypothetical protein
MAEVGLLAPDARVELIEGEIIDMAPIGVDHNGVLNQLSALLHKAAREWAIVQTQGVVRLDRTSEPQSRSCAGGYCGRSVPYFLRLSRSPR